ncbi:MAG: histone deacetylase family protein [Gammaproteobacteria bacterium]|nr:histone deacetylase family protein [Gammaproteobacteria bacterium]
MSTAYLTHPVFLQHEMGAHHPERPARLYAIEDRLIASGLFDLLRHYRAPRASREALLRVHTADYLDLLAQRSPQQGYRQLDPDTMMNPHTLEAAWHAAGAAVQATDLVLSGVVENAFCAVRPPGHHALAARAMGFCFFNNIAVGVAHALAAHGLQRVAIVDFDVHHGNGSEAIFAADDRVLLCSSFQHPFYPGTDLKPHHPNIVHAPLRAGDGSSALRAAYSEHLLPALEAFAPQMIFISAGFDGHVEDEMSALQLTDGDYAWLTRQLVDAAARHAQGRLVSLLEGGYALNALGRSCAQHIRVLMGLHGEA